MSASNATTDVTWLHSSSTELTCGRVSVPPLDEQTGQSLFGFLSGCNLGSSGLLIDSVLGGVRRERKEGEVTFRRQAMSGDDE